MTSPQLSIIVPAYNEATRIGSTLRAILDYLNSHAPQSELIVVDDGSMDETSEVARQCFEEAGKVDARVLRYEPNRGKGYAVRLGLLEANAPLALFTDADLSTPMTETPKLIEPIERSEADLTFGSRALERDLIGVHQSWRREQGGRVFNLIVRLLTGLPFWDTQCGCKAFRMSVCRPIIEAAKIDRFGFDVELLYVAYSAGLRLKEMPVRWNHSESVLDASGNYARDSLRMFNEVRLIRRQSRAGLYRKAIAEARQRAEREREQASQSSNDDTSSTDEDAADLLVVAPENRSADTPRA